MRAVLCKSFGPPRSLVVEDVPEPRAGRGEVVLDVRACGVNFPDTLIIQGKYQFRPDPPFSPGGEIAGVVREVGEGVTAVQPGDRVVALVAYGGYAERISVIEQALLPIPDGIDDVTAASLLTAHGTALYALRERAETKPGETVLVLGAAGGVGLAAIDVAKVLGARVVAAASGDEKLALCRARGADETIDYSKEDLKQRLKAITHGDGVDVVFDPVGGAYSEAALRGIAWRGRHLVVGFAAGDIPKIPLNLTLLKGCSIVGVFWGSHLVRDPEKARADHAELFAWVKDGRFRPHVHAVMPLERAGDALDELLSRRVRGKVVLTTAR